MPIEQIHLVQADIFAPCALSGALSEQTISQLPVRIVAGGANNQFANEEAGPPALAARGIVHAPDYVINAGGLIQCYVRDVLGKDDVSPWLNRIGPTLSDIFTESAAEHVPPLTSADRLAPKFAGRTLQPVRGQRKVSNCRSSVATQESRIVVFMRRSQTVDDPFLRSRWSYKQFIWLGTKAKYDVEPHVDPDRAVDDARDRRAFLVLHGTSRRIAAFLTCISAVSWKVLPDRLKKTKRNRPYLRYQGSCRSSFSTVSDST